VGTLDYLSPEQALGNPLDERSDIFSFGIVFYQMLVGTHPFASASVTQMVARMMTQEAHVIPESAPIPEVLRQILARALKKDASERYGSAAQMLLDLMVARRELGSVSRTDKLLGMAKRVSAAEMRAAVPAGGAGERTDVFSRAVPVPEAPEPRTPRTAPAEVFPPRRFPAAARIGAAVAALLALGAVAVWLLS